MKSLFLMLIYVATFIGMFMILSLIGFLWNDNYRDIVTSRTWFMLYSLFLGWWVAMIPTREYYKHNELYFEEFL